MTCKAVLLNETNNKILKYYTINRDTYRMCQEEVDKRNSKLKYPKKWVITAINV